MLLLDLSLPDMSGLDVLRQIKAHHETVATLVLSAYPGEAVRPERAARRRERLRQQDRGRWRAVPRDPRRGARRTLREPGARRRCWSAACRAAPGEPRHSVLSEREFQIFCKLAEGKSVSEIAAKLFLSVKTVSTYRTRILEKMGMKTNADITYYAIKNNLLQ